MSNDLQRTDKWFEDRLGFATGSKFHDVVAGPRLAGWKNYKAQLVAERLTGVREETWQSAAMKWGVDNEPLAKLAYTFETGLSGYDKEFIKHPALAAGVSPDWELNAYKGVEIKCPNTATHIETLRTMQLPKQYKAQVQGQMWIMGWDEVDFVSFDPRLPENARLAIIQVKRDDVYITQLETTIVAFLDEVEQDTEFVKAYGRASQ